MDIEEIYREVLMKFGGLFAQELKNSLEKNYRYSYGFAGDAYSKGRNQAYRSDGNKVATGALRDSIAPKWDSSNNQLIIEMLYYWKFVNDGRQPGKYVPIKPLEDWASRKGIPNPRGAAFGISTNIKKFGIEPTYFYDKAFTEFENKYASQLEQEMLLTIEQFFDKITEQSIQ